MIDRKKKETNNCKNDQSVKHVQNLVKKPMMRKNKLQIV